MSDEAGKSEYLLLFRGAHWDKDLSADEMQRVVNKWMTWFEGLTRDGRAKAGQPLLREGKIVSGKNGRTVADGPFAESKEAIGGYFLLQVSGMDEAIEIARQCPALEYGLEVEVRPVAEQCTTRTKVSEMLAAAEA